MRTVVLVPRRADHGHRDRVWAWCRAWWEREFPRWPIFEGHHDDGLFNRSAAVNRAAAQAGRWDVALLIDADVIADPATIREAVARATGGDHLVLPFNVRHNLTQRGSEAIMAGESGSWRGLVGITYRDQCSAIVAIPRGMWDAVGGFDEKFVGWGFEDNAFACSVETYGRSLEHLDGEVWHLWHPTAREGRKTSPTFRANRARHELYRAALGKPDEIRALIDGGAEPVVAIRERENIPRILHRVVPERTTPEVEGWWRRFEALHPGWTLMTHRDPLDPKDWPLTAKAWSQCTSGAQLAGLVRLEALHRWGGVYVDSDCEPFRSLEPLLPLRAFAAWEDATTVPDAVIGAEPEHPAIRACLDRALQVLRKGAWASGPGVLTAILPRRSDVTLLPPGTFYPYHYREKERRSENHAKAQPWAFMAHHWAGSWLAPAAGERATPLDGESPAMTPSSGTRLSILVPFRDADGSRTAARDWVLARWRHHWPDAEIVVAADDGIDPFCKSLAVNNAAAQATGDVFVILDADTWVEPERIQTALDLIASGAAPWVIPARRSARLNRRFSDAVMALAPTEPLPPVSTSSRVIEQYGPVVGFCHVVPRAAFEAVGGMDVRFRGWGGEDSSFMRALDVVVGRHVILTGKLVSLWHERPRDRARNRVWAGQNREHMAARNDLGRRYAHARSRDQMLALLAEGAA